MPVMNGLEAAVQIRGHGSRVATVYVTAHHEWELLEAACKTGALGYVTAESRPRSRSGHPAALEGRQFVSDAAHDVVAAIAGSGAGTKMFRPSSAPGRE